jgi:hypothetical protein
VPHGDLWLLPEMSCAEVVAVLDGLSGYRWLLVVFRAGNQQGACTKPQEGDDYWALWCTH